MNSEKPNQLVTRWLTALQRHRWLVAVAVLALSLLSLAAVSTLRVETDWTRLMPYAEDMTVFRALSRLGSSSELMLHLEAANGTPIAPLADSVQRFTDSVQALDLFPLLQSGGGLQSLETFRPEFTLFLGTEGTRTLARRFQPDEMRTSIAALTDRLFSPAAGLVRGFLEHDPLQISSLALANLEGRGGYTLRDGMIQSEDGQTALLIALPPPQPDGPWMARLATAIPLIKKAAQREGLICRMPSGLFLRAELFESIKRDLVKVSSLSLLLILLLFLAVYRRAPTAALCVMLPQVVALLITFALYRLFATEIGLITSMAAAMLTGLGVDFGIHLMARYREETGTSVARLTTALLGTGRGNLAGALSTSVAFFSILVTGMTSFHLLGCTAGFGILLSVSSYFLLFPLFIFLFNPYEKPAREDQTPRKATLWQAARPPKIFPPPWWARVLASLLKTGYLRFSWCVLVVFVVILPFSAKNWHFSSKIDEFLPENSQIYQDMQRVDEKSIRFGPDQADCLFLEIENRDFFEGLTFLTGLKARLPEAEWQTPFNWLPDSEFLTENRAFFLKSLENDGISPEMASKTLNNAYEGLDLVFPEVLERYPADVIASFAPEFQTSFFQQLPFAAPFYALDGSSFFVMAEKADRSNWTSDELSRIDREAEAADLNVEFSTSALFVDSLRLRVIPDTLLAAGVTVVAMLILLYFFFRRRRLVILTFLPLTAGLLFTLILMGLFRQSFNYFNLTVLPLIFGLGIDDGIHYIQSCVECGNSTEALRRTARPILLTTATTCIGFGTLMFVSFNGIFSMGFLMVTGMISCLLAVLFLLPPVARWCLRNQNNNQKTACGVAL